MFDTHKFLIITVLIGLILVLTSCSFFKDNNLEPVAIFTYSPLNPIIEETVVFNDASVIPDGKIMQWEWSFGDGTKSGKQNPEHAYSAAGNYQVCLSIYTDDGLKDSACKEIPVADESNQLPQPNFNHDPYSPMEDETVHFDASSSFDPDGTIVSYKWDFGDGDQDEGMTVAHSYRDSGPYQATLTVEDDKEAFNSITKLIPVSCKCGG